MMPDRSFVMADDTNMCGYKLAKERLTFLFGGNASGTMKSKPFVIGKSENPRCFKNIQKDGLPVTYRSNKKAWMTKALFTDWFYNEFCPEVERFCRMKNINFNILLLLDNAPGHPKVEELPHPNVKIHYLPANTTSILQPMDMGVISTFKKTYLRNTYREALLATDPINPKRISLPEFWKGFTVLNCIEHAYRAWDSISEHTMKSMWKNIFKHRKNEPGKKVTNIKKSLLEKKKKKKCCFPQNYERKKKYKKKNKN